MNKKVSWGDIIQGIIEANPQEMDALMLQINYDYRQGRKIYPSIDSIFAMCKAVPLEECRTVLVGGTCLEDVVKRCLRELVGEGWKEAMRANGIINIYEHLTVTKTSKHDWSYFINMLIYHLSRHNKNCSFIFIGEHNWDKEAYVIGKTHKVTKIAGNIAWELEDLLQDGLRGQHVGNSR